MRKIYLLILVFVLVNKMGHLDAFQKRVNVKEAIEQIRELKDEVRQHIMVEILRSIILYKPTKWMLTA